MNDIQEILDIYNQQKGSWKLARKNKDYNVFGLAGGDEIECWLNKLLRFRNQLPSLCYAYGISFECLKMAFPEIFSIKYHYDNVKGKDWPTFEQLESKNLSEIKKDILEEIFDQKRWDWYNLDSRKLDYEVGAFNQYATQLSINDQLNFINLNKTRNPKKILEIGGGRGEIANSLKFLGVDCISIDPGLEATKQYSITGKHFFGNNFRSVEPVCQSLGQAVKNLNLTDFDTIIFCESIEHVQESEFYNFWNLVLTKFQGIFIVTNDLYYHPIPIQEPEHIFEISDSLYDKLVSQSKNCWYRNHSHLVLDI